MKKLAILFLVLSMILPVSAFAKGASTYKYHVEVVDLNGDPVTDETATIYVKTVNTNTNASIWPAADTTTGTLTGAVTIDANGKGEWYGTATSYDVVVQYRGDTYVYQDFAPSSDKRIVVDTKEPVVDLNSLVASGSTVTLPLYGDFFQISGTTNINNITSTGHQIGKRVLLLFGGNLQIGENGNITISQTFGGAANTGANAGTLTVGSGTLLEVVWDGTKWRVIR